MQINKKINGINKYLPFGLKVEKLLPYFIAAKLFSFAGLALFIMSK